VKSGTTLKYLFIDVLKYLFIYFLKACFIDCFMTFFIDGFIDRLKVINHVVMMLKCAWHRGFRDLFSLQKKVIDSLCRM